VVCDTEKLRALKGHGGTYFGKIGQVNVCQACVRVEKALCLRQLEINCLEMLKFAAGSWRPAEHKKIESIFHFQENTI
jgi:hypothetical protein